MVESTQTATSGGNSGGNTSNATAYDQITIQGKVFRVPLRYASGHVINDGEAGALNQTLHENIRNNMAKKITEGTEAGLDDAVLQQQVDDFANDYQFGVRGGRGSRSDPVMTLAMNTAREMVRGALKRKEADMDEWPASRISKLARDLLDSQGEDGNIIKTARKTVEAEREAAKSAMTEINELIASA